MYQQSNFPCLRSIPQKSFFRNLYLCIQKGSHYSRLLRYYKLSAFCIKNQIVQYFLNYKTLSFETSTTSMSFLKNPINDYPTNNRLLSTMHISKCTSSISRQRSERDNHPTEHSYPEEASLSLAAWMSSILSFSKRLLFCRPFQLHSSGFVESKAGSVDVDHLRLGPLLIEGFLSYEVSPLVGMSSTLMQCENVVRSL